MFFKQGNMKGNFWAANCYLSFLELSSDFCSHDWVFRFSKFFSLADFGNSTFRFFPPVKLLLLQLLLKSAHLQKSEIHWGAQDGLLLQSSFHLQVFSVFGVFSVLCSVCVFDFFTVLNHGSAVLCSACVFVYFTVLKHGSAGRTRLECWSPTKL